MCARRSRSAGKDPTGCTPPVPDLPEAKARRKPRTRVAASMSSGRGVFRPRLLGGLFGDPVVYAHLSHQGRSVLFDAGDLGPLWSRALHKLSHVFVSHTHLDHFFDFDRFLRAEMTFLGQRKRPLVFIGPRGLAKKIASRIDSYTWNLLSEPRPFFLVMEISRNRGQGWYKVPLTNGSVVVPSKEEEFPRETCFEFQAEVLDHGGIDSVCFCLKERQGWSVDRDALTRLGLESGKWLDRLLALAREGLDDTIRAKTTVGEKEFSGKSLAKEVLIPRPGQKLCFITDADVSGPNMDKMVRIAEAADWLFCETRYMDKDSDLALETGHLTIGAAARLVREARARLVTPMHAAGRYADKGEKAAFLKELRSAFPRLALYEKPVVPEPDAIY